MKDQAMPLVVKSPGLLYTGGPSIGHCYNDAEGECSFWKHDGEKSYCMLFGGPEGVPKFASESLSICDTVYGLFYAGRP
jgi:hypothetical protein